MTYYALDAYSATAGQTDFVISFPYISYEHIIVAIEGEEQTYGTDWTLANATTVRLATGASLGEVVTLRRETSPGARVVDWQEAAYITEADLDYDSLQAFYRTQELADIGQISISIGDDGAWDAEGNQIKNVGDPTEAQDAVTKAYVDAIGVTAGNVPTPDNPGDNGKPLVASAGGFDWGTIDHEMVEASDAVECVWASEDVSDMRANLSLGTASLYDTGITAGTIPLITTGNELPVVGGTNLDLSGQPYGWWVPITSGNISDAAQYTKIEHADFVLYDVLLFEFLATTATDSDLLYVRPYVENTLVTDIDWVYTVAYDNAGTGTTSVSCAKASAFAKLTGSCDSGHLHHSTCKIYQGGASNWGGTNVIYGICESTNPRATAEDSVVLGYGRFWTPANTGALTALDVGTDQAARYPKTGSKYRVWGMKSGF